MGWRALGIGRCYRRQARRKGRWTRHRCLRMRRKRRRCRKWRTHRPHQRLVHRPRRRLPLTLCRPSPLAQRTTHWSNTRHHRLQCIPRSPPIPRLQDHRATRQAARSVLRFQTRVLLRAATCAGESSHRSGRTRSKRSSTAASSIKTTGKTQSCRSGNGSGMHCSVPKSQRRSPVHRTLRRRVSANGRHRSRPRHACVAHRLGGARHLRRRPSPKRRPDAYRPARRRLHRKIAPITSAASVY